MIVWTFFFLIVGVNLDPEHCKWIKSFINNLVKSLLMFGYKQAKSWAFILASLIKSLIKTIVHEWACEQ